MTRPRASVVIPAHNEDSVIGACLDALWQGATPGDWEVVVAANGCEDRTVLAAQEHPSAPTVIDVPAPGKTGALNAADAVAVTFPRVYLDADVRLTGSTLHALVDELEGPGVMAAAPRGRIDVSRSSRGVRAYYRLWRQLPVLDDAYVGGGVMGVSAEGHARIAPFPRIIADDEYVRRSFSAEERRRSPGHFEVRAASDLRGQVRRGTRVRAGNAQLDSMGLQRPPAEGDSSVRFVLSRARSVREWPGVAVFIGVTVAVRALGAWKRRFGDMSVWDRDDSSRQ